VKTGEAAFITRAPTGATSLIFSDAVMNLNKLPLWLRPLRYGCGPAVTSIFKQFVVADRAALRAHLERLAATPGLTRLVVWHGDIVKNDPAEVLRSVVKRL
jgi:hypothetical protein